ncbi:hypothetical protein Airi02_013090 [Actinoallomurus iriomotensis]|uniref:Uncharacterized protein n=1 Tax=Actinoallomurus iriomotensis TaxID=478107 RepID=A0A9W6VXL7_9ACTN|nr:hypothetical protein Airi02_013090 [Actinoallomurus iriomotensis]
MNTLICSLKRSSGARGPGLSSVVLGAGWTHALFAGPARAIRIKEKYEAGRAQMRQPRAFALGDHRKGGARMTIFPSGSDLNLIVWLPVVKVALCRLGWLGPCRGGM